MKRAVVITLMMAASAAVAAPVVAQTANGTLAALEPDGTLRITGPHAGTVKLGAPGGSTVTAQSKLVIGAVGTTPTIIAELATASVREAVIVEWKAGWRVVARSPLGGIGLDEEYAYAIELTPVGVVRYQERAGIARCDGAPGYLFAEQLVGGAFVPLAKPPTLIPPVTTLLPVVATPLGAPPLVFAARAASTEAGITDAGGLGNPTELSDNQPTTTWREGLAKSAGEGQWFTFVARIADVKPVELRVVVPARAVKGALQPNRPHTLVILAGGVTYGVVLPDPLATAGAVGPFAFVATLPATASGTCVTVILKDTYGKPDGETQIAELGVYAESDGLAERKDGGERVLAHAIAKGGTGATQAAGALSKRGAAAVAALDLELASATDAHTRARLVTALARVEDPSAAASLAHAVELGWAGDAELVEIVAALARSGQVPALLALLKSPHMTAELRVAAVSGIPPTGAGYQALVAIAGRGPAVVRRAVIERLRLAPPLQLVADAAGAASSQAAGDLYRAATKHARGDERTRAATVTAMVAALPDASDYERRYRLVDGIAENGDAAAITTLEAALNALAARATTPVSRAEATALREVAVRGIGSAPRPAGAALVLAAMSDPDPGVRLAAIFALSSAGDDLGDPGGPWHAPDGANAIDRAIINGLIDHWPEVRRRAAAALGSRCARTGPAQALQHAVATDAELDVRRDALTALVQCHAPGIGALLATTWDNEALPVELRSHAVQLAIALGDPTLATTLVQRFARWRGEALESTGALVLAQTAAAAIGKLAPPGAAAVLVAALDDAAFPEIVTAAALGLGDLGEACPSTARAKLKLLATTAPQAAAAATHSAALCTGP